jgi:hypothetical protein
MSRSYTAVTLELVWALVSVRSCMAATSEQAWAVVSVRSYTAATSEQAWAVVSVIGTQPAASGMLAEVRMICQTGLAGPFRTQTRHGPPRQLTRVDAAARPAGNEHRQRTRRRLGRGPKSFAHR